LLAAGVIGIVATIVCLATFGVYPAVAGAVLIAAGSFLLMGRPGAVRWVRSLAVLLVAACVSLMIAVPFYQPLDLTITEIRLEPFGLITRAAPAFVGFAVLLWVARELGRQPVNDAIAAAGLKTWDMRIPAQGGAGIVALGCLLVWLALHGQSAQLAESLALQQLGPDYRYHLRWISSARSEHGTSVSGVVTAWNAKEIKRVLLHWETR
jgi:NADH:ubiquinone oxidoreductase subunit K